MDAPYQPHSATSRDAATKIRPKAETLRAMVLTAIESLGDRGLTDEEMQHDLGLEGSTQRPRRVELLRAGERAAGDGVGGDKMRSVAALMDLFLRADRVMAALRAGDIVRFNYPTRMVISEMVDVILEMADRIAFLEKKARDGGDRGKRELAADLIALQDENFALKNRIKDLAASLPKQTHTHHAVDNLGSSSSLEAMVGCGASYRGKTQIGVGSYQANRRRIVSG